MTASTLTATCASWCHQPGQHDTDDPCISDTPHDTLITPTGEANHYLTRTADGTMTVRVETGPLDGGPCAAVEASVAEARAWFAAGLAACDLAADPLRVVS